MMLESGSRLGAYEVVGPIGVGGMGEVYRATDTRLHREVAVKVSGERFAERFEAEARLIAALNHPNICTLHDVGPNYLVMELVEGPTLAERIAQGPLPLDEALAIAAQIQLALAAAHERGIVHRDLKPGNIKIKADGSVKVLDFGLAKLGGTPTAQHLDLSPTMSVAATQAGVILGTAAYMAPEQARGKAVDKRADIWAFGVVLYEMLVGRKLFEGEGLTEILAAVIEREVDLRKVPAKVQPLLRSCLQKDPRKRLQDIADATLLLELAPLGEAPSSGPVPAAPTWRRWLWQAAAALLLLTSSVLAAIHFREKPPAAPDPVRFQISSPPLGSGTEFYLAMSPDGRKLAYTGIGSDGLNHIWVRAMDTLDSRMLSGTDGAVSLFWSPDSRFIGFGQANRLKKIDATGAAPSITLSEGQAPVGMGSWSKDDVIVFGTRGGSGPLRRVSASGGPATEITSLRKDETFHSFPVFLPDGHHFVFLRASVNTDVRGIYAGSLDAAPDQQPTTRVLAAQFGAPYVPSRDGPGRLLFLREGILMSQPFDTERLALTGEPVPIAEQVGAAGSGGFFTASVNGTLVYRTGGGAGRQLIWYDRQGTVTGRPGPSALYSDIALSPDGTRVVSFQEGGQNDTWLFDLTRNANTRLTFDQKVERNPVWSPDASQIAYGTPTEIVRKASNGAGDAELLLKVAGAAPLSWSSDGRYLLYAVNDAKTSVDLWVLPLQGEPAEGRKPFPFLVTPFLEMQAQFSPDGRWVVYESTESGQPEVYVRPFVLPGSSSAAAGGKWMVSNRGGAQPRWRGDGNEIAYLTATGKLMSVDVGAAGSSFQAGVPKPLFDVPVAGGPFAAQLSSRWDLTRDGQKVLVAANQNENSATPITVLQHWEALLKK